LKSESARIWGFSALVTTLLLAGACSRDSAGGQRLVGKKAVENAHGVSLPGSVRNCQQKKHGGFLDHGIVTLFELDPSEVQQFVAQLRINSRHLPAKTGIGNPCVNGWNVWPPQSDTFVPGSRELEGLRATWSGEATPIEMLSCDSPKGDWLHVEIWRVNNGALIKLYTNWN
jgi:hypothetical protein